MDTLISQWSVSIRMALAPFSVVIGMMGLFPGLVPVGFECLVPVLEEMPPLHLYAHLIGNAVLILSGVWLLLGFCGAVSALLSISLLSFYVYLVRVAFHPPLTAIVVYGAFLVAVVGVIALRRLNAEVDPWL